MQVRNIRISTYVQNSCNYALCMMSGREYAIGQELKNGYIVYDKEGRLTEYQEQYKNDQFLTFYRNRIEISSKLIQKIRQNAGTRRKIEIPTTIKIYNPYQMTALDMISALKSILHYYEFESNEVYNPCEYVIYDEENIEILKDYLMKKKENQVKYSSSLIRPLKADKQKGMGSTMKQEEFYEKCISFIQSQIPHISVLNYLDREEIEIYNRIKDSLKGKRLVK